MNKRIKKGLAGAGLALTLALSVGACSSYSAPAGNQQESQQQQADTTNLEQSQKLPVVFYSQERANLIDIELAEVNDVRTTTFIKAQANVDPIFSCPSVGFGIPDSASLSNPLQIGWSYNGWNNGAYDSGVVGQMDPNGIYAPTSSEGTWVICLDDHGVAYINRFEDKTDTVGGPAEWDYGKHFITRTGAPTALATTVDGKRQAVDVRNKPGTVATKK